jgi:hypothetical protein
MPYTVILISAKMAEIHLKMNFGTLAGLWPWAIGPSLKIEVLGFFIITMKFLIHRA